MSFWQSILFGIIQGFTEIFPVSSSGHLSILGNLFGLNRDLNNFKMFTVFLHFGSLLSIMIVYLPELGGIMSDAASFLEASTQGKVRKRYASARLLLMIIVSCIPLLLLIPFIKYIDSLYYSSYFVGAMMILSGFILFISDRLQFCTKDERNMTFMDAVLIGLCQIVSAIPGISRVGMVMTASKAVGLSNEFSVKYAYLLSIPVIFGMNIIHLVEAASLGFYWSDVPMYLVGIVISMITGFLAMRIVRSAAESGYFHRFAYYLWVAGVLFIILTMIF